MPISEQATISSPPGTIATGVLDITVLAGGPGVEREVSLQSGQAVCDALRRVGHRVSLCDIEPGDLSALDRAADIVFIALHGEFGEDGVLQAKLAARGIAFTGCDAASSRLAIDKVAAKQRFEREGIPTPPYEVVDAQSLSGLASRFAAPAFVKPVSSGSSVDTTLASTAQELTDAAAHLVSQYGAALVEQRIEGPELTVGVLGEEALPVCEIRTARPFYDYQAKYVDETTQYLFDLDLPAEFLSRVESLSVAAHKALGCGVLSRVDWMVDAATMTPHILEINTIPGFTGHSLVPKAAARVGLTFEQLCQRVVELSLGKAAK